MKKRTDFENDCEMCEYSQEIMNGEYLLCSKKGIVEFGEGCSRFQFDPLKIKVSVRKLPEFRPIDFKD